MYNILCFALCKITSFPVGSLYLFVIWKYGDDMVLQSLLCSYSLGSHVQYCI